MSDNTVTDRNVELAELFEQLKPNLVSTDTRVGEMAVYKNDKVVSYALRLYGEYCNAEVEIMSNFLNKDSLYLDIGTNVGYHILGVHKKTGCKAIGFEPHIKHFAVASYNCQTYADIALVNAALSDTAGDITLTDFDESIIENYGEVKIPTGEVEKTISAKAMRLDDIGLSACHVMKIDVEGNEMNVLNGAENTINTFRPVIMYEAMDEDVWTQCDAFMRDKNYKQYWIISKTNPLTETYKPRSADHDPFGQSSVPSVLCIPEEREQYRNLVPVIQGEYARDCITRYKNYKLIF
jgi:FkbM family methyltransferase